MAHWGRSSLTRLDSCDVRIKIVFNTLIARLPVTINGICIDDAIIIEGHRGSERQNMLEERGLSQLRWPLGKHNKTPSLAVDAAPYHRDRPHIHWTDLDGMEAFSHLVLGIAKEEHILMRWGGDWDRDGVRVDSDPDERFLDGPHYELLYLGIKDD